MSDILLIRTPYSEVYTDFKELSKIHTRIPPLGLMYLAASLEAGGYDVEIIDLEIEQQRKVFKKNISKTKARFVGIGAATPEISEATSLIKRIKKSREDLITILGGPHATIFPEDALKKTSADYLLRGEGEETLPMLIHAIEKNKKVDNIPGVCVLKKGKFVHITKPRHIKNLDVLPFPARHLVKNEEYTFPVRGKGVIPAASLITTRGCPYNCIYCTKLFGNTVRFRSVQNVMAEMTEITEKYQLHYITVWDDTFTLDKKRVLSLCKEITKQRLDVSWSAMMRADTISKNILAAMRKAGCIRISMGVESGTQKSLNTLNKGTTLNQYTQGYEWAKELGFETRGSFIIGSPYETRKDIQATIEFAKKLKLDEAYFNIMTPYPGTTVYEMTKRREGIHFKDTNPNFVDFKRWGNAITELEEVSSKELVSFQKQAVLQFYMRPGVILHQLRKLSFEQSSQLAKYTGKIIAQFFWDKLRQKLQVKNARK